MKIAIADILVDEGFIEKYDLIDEGAFKTIRITLKYGADKNEKIITGIKRISKPGLRIYAGKDEIPTVLGGLGIAILFHQQGYHHGQGSKKASGRRRSSRIRLVGRKHLMRTSRRRSSNLV